VKAALDMRRDDTAIQVPDAVSLALRSRPTPFTATGITPFRRVDNVEYSFVREP